ncbi:MAG: PASTA domain-containing protein [Draconibacterium sp.]|nr:PASTA domain-containing protein [Draconibacterium sp.]
MSFKKFLVSRVFFLNLIIAIILVVVIIFFIRQSLNTYTRHGQSRPVPNFIGMSPTEAIEIAEQQNLKIIVIDSVFTEEVMPGKIIEQVPYEGLGVKENRTIFITINSTQKEQVVLPKLTDISFRQAQVLVGNWGLQIGEISYKPSEYNNLVLKVKQDTIELFQGDIVLKGSIINFIVGRDTENEETPLPNLKGDNIESAKKVITDAMLNFGVLIYDETILTAEDSINATIWKQSPDVNARTFVRMGTSIDLWVTIDEEKIIRATEK